MSHVPGCLLLLLINQSRLKLNRIFQKRKKLDDARTLKKNLTMWTFEADATCAHVSCATPQPMQCTLATASKHACEPEYCIRTSIARTRPTKTGSCPPSRAAPGRAGVRVREPQHPQSSVPMQGGAAELPGPEKGSASPEACP